MGITFQSYSGKTGAILPGATRVNVFPDSSYQDNNDYQQVVDRNFFKTE